MVGPKGAAMYDIKTGNTIPFNGLTTRYAMMPMFSPDGLHAAYTAAPEFDDGVGARHLHCHGLQLRHEDLLEPRHRIPRQHELPFRLAFLHARQQVGHLRAGHRRTTSPARSRRFPAPPFNSQLYIVPAAGGAAHRLDSASGLDPAGNDDGRRRRTITTSTSIRRSTPSPRAATSGLTSLAAARTETCTPRARETSGASRSG